MSTSYDLPLPSESFDGGTVIASVWLNEEDKDGPTAVLLILDPTPEFYRLQDIQWSGGGWSTGWAERHPNIVPAVEAYQRNGGDY